MDEKIAISQYSLSASVACGKVSPSSLLLPFDALLTLIVSSIVLLWCRRPLRRPIDRLSFSFSLSPSQTFSSSLRMILLPFANLYHHEPSLYLPSLSTVNLRNFLICTFFFFACARFTIPSTGFALFILSTHSSLSPSSVPLLFSFYAIPWVLQRKVSLYYPFFEPRSHGHERARHVPRSAPLS